MEVRKKPCTCGAKLTTKTTIKIGKNNFAGTKTLWLNCKNCGSTLILVNLRKAA